MKEQVMCGLLVTFPSKLLTQTQIKTTKTKTPETYVGNI